MSEWVAARRSVLEDSALPRGHANVIELAPSTRFVFRGDAVARALCSEAFGVPLLQEACRAADGGTRAALWLGPDEWLLVAGETERAALTAALEQALISAPYSLVDVSHRQIGVEVSGPGAVRLLNGCVLLDLDQTAFPVGMCTRTVFAKAEIVLWRTADETFHIEVWRSFAAYVVALLREMASFGEI